MSDKKYKYRFTLFTPCYNSAPFIERIKASVENQTFKDFEWIVVNDNSSDNTLALLNDYIKTVKFPVKLINNTTNKMLAANYNLAVEQTEGEYFVTLDHDDEYSPNYLEIMDKLITQYDSPKIAGVVARCKTQFGKITPDPAYSRVIMNWFEYGKDSQGKGTGEVPRAFKTDILRKYIPFDVNEVHNPLVEAMMSYDGYSFITTNEIIRKYYVDNATPQSITSQGVSRLKVWRYRSYLREINQYCTKYHRTFKVTLSMCLQYSVAAIRLNMSFKEAIQSICRYRILVSLLYPFAFVWVLVAKNQCLRSVINYYINKKGK